MSKFLEVFGLPKMPWVIRAYLLLFLIVGALLLFSATTGLGMVKLEAEQAKKVFDISADAFKLVLGALIGSLSMAADRTWGQGERSGKRRGTRTQGDP